MIRNKIPTAREIWFLFISATRYTPKLSTYNGYIIKSVTIPDLLDKISSLSDAKISTLAKTISIRLGAWIPQLHEAQASSYVSNFSSIPSREPSEFITHHNLWDSLGDRTIVGEIVWKQIEQFANHYSKLPLITRRVIAKVVQRATLPNWPSRKLEMSLQELELYLSADEHSSFDSIITTLENKDLAYITEKNHKLSEQGEEIHIYYDNYLTLDWRMSEPDYDMFAALKSYYSAHAGEQKLFYAFEFSDFSDIR